MIALKKTRDTVTTSIIVPLVLRACPRDDLSRYQISTGAVVVNIVLMAIVPMDSARWQAPGLPVPGEGAFDAFVTTKPSGMELGLAICRMTLERHNGRFRWRQFTLTARRVRFAPKENGQPDKAAGVGSDLPKSAPGLPGQVVDPLDRTPPECRLSKAPPRSGQDEETSHADDWRSASTASSAIRSLRPCLKWAEKRGFTRGGLTDLEQIATTRRRDRVVSAGEISRIWCPEPVRLVSASDRRVIEAPRLLWFFILNGLILTTRPGRKGKDYATIWNHDRDESPLKTISRSQAEKLQRSIRNGRVGETRADVVVDWGMRYGNPSIKAAVERLAVQGCDCILFVPLYPQYSAATSATACDKIFGVLASMRKQPALRVAAPYYDDDAYIDEIARSLADRLESVDFEPEVILASFHGMPLDTLIKGIRTMPSAIEPRIWFAFG
jgi:hypothetical protein